MTTKAGRPRGFDRDAALDTAMRLFWDKGYDATSIADLTAALGIAAPSLYAAFGGKRELFEQSIRHYQDAGRIEFSAILDAAPSAREGIARLLRDRADDFTDPAHPPGCMVLSAATNCATPEVATSLRDRRLANTAVVRRRIQRDIDSGLLDASADAEALTMYVGAVIQGMSAQARDGATREQLRGVAAAAMRAWPVADAE
ncbi:MAG TPA: TetR/AcrR family transcriptional regulator [Stackebrandtia sp.]|uniref:TetR/AcrR family transcriptional regulator n=1 Tax=Stackebrandtia sp. TaxID=2023065 RepID=UPI002D266018|nr:TetR/AcrR family transcriptional regulator [Stackebrandtia sp.]HZE37292.1 TetR/AcrR family transcriptional regulator [Stackebrandtia sp.]